MKFSGPTRGWCTVAVQCYNRRKLNQMSSGEFLPYPSGGMSRSQFHTVRNEIIATPYLSKDPADVLEHA